MGPCECQLMGQVLRHIDGVTPAKKALSQSHYFSPHPLHPGISLVPFSPLWEDWIQMEFGDPQPRPP